MDIIKKLAQELGISETQVKNTVDLIDEGNTIPFIARYRKEVTGSLDDQILRDLDDRLQYLRGLEKRKDEIRKIIIEQEKMTDDIESSIAKAQTLAEIEDIYRPFKQKRRTRASIARERGLEPLAELLLSCDDDKDPIKEAENFIDEENDVPDTDGALAGAMDIIAEQISDDPALRKELREFTFSTAMLTSKAVDEDEDSVYSNYYDFAEPISKIPGHRILALDRGEREGILRVGIELDEERAVSIISKMYVQGHNECANYVMLSCEDSYKRLIAPSIEREVRGELTDNACTAAIKVFSANLRQLLMQPPVKGTVTLGLDPAYRTGCKIAVVDDTGKVLDTTVIYPTPPQSKVAESKAKMKSLIKKYGVTTIAIGNGTASRESEAFVAELIKEIPQKVAYMVVSEAGASVYSASKLAAEEFPQFDVSLRSAVSIARRLQDPLAELVKIDPKAIGVGQYQHDMPKNQLGNALSGVVEDCVNNVGVDLNTASQSLLGYTAGVNARVAKNIVAYREENGAFTSRKELLKVKMLGKKAFEQCAGFLRIQGGANPLDNTAVHPESYENAKAMLEHCGFELSDIGGGVADIKERASQYGIAKLAKEIGIGEPTLNDILDELVKPGRDPRDELDAPLLRSDVVEMKDLKEGMELMGTVRNIVDFGAFVDIGVHEDGLVHISQLADRYIKHPLDVVKVGDVVKVRVMSVDEKRGRIALTMRI